MVGSFDFGTSRNEEEKRLLHYSYGMLQDELFCFFLLNLRFYLYETILL